MRWLAMIVLVSGLVAYGEEPGGDPAAVAKASLANGGRYLLKHQNEDGSWGKRPMIGVAALGAVALHECPGLDAGERDAAVERAMAFILDHTLDGGAVAQERRGVLTFWKKAPVYANYSTALALLALATVNKPEYLEPMKRARAYLKDQQIADKDAKGFGGFGYGGGQGGADMSNTAWIAEALHVTEYLDREPYAADDAEVRRTREMWASLATFLEKHQKLPAEGEAAEGSDIGGFSYKPQEQGAASRMVVTGSMSYAGLKSMLYAKLGEDDPRVRGALRFLRHNYDLKANPGMGEAGYFYYMQTLAKALDAYGADELRLADGTVADWKRDLIERLAGKQREDGSWVNDHGRFMESMPSLVTSYAMISLKLALK